MNDDAVLLRRYVDEGSEEAFTVLVQKHIDLVYSAALRRTGGDVHRAADVAQEVFTALARQARDLSAHPVLGGWLHSATRNIAVNLMLSDQRRERRHSIAMALETAQSAEPAPEWEQLRPVLDAALDELPERDRHPVVMRFLERRPFKEIGAVLTISEDAARVRTDRALEKLRAVLARRGITSTAAALGAAVSTYGTVGAPPGLAPALASESLASTAGGVGAMGSAISLVVAKFAATAAVSTVVAFVLGVWVNEHRAAAPTPPSPGVAPSAAFSALSDENRRLETELRRLNVDVDRWKAANAKLLAERSRSAPALGRTGGIVGAPLQRHEIQDGVLFNLRQLAAAQDQYKLEMGRWPSSIKELVGAVSYIKRIVPVDGEDYTKASMGGGSFRVTTATGVTVGYSNGNDHDPKAPEFNNDYPPEIERFFHLRGKVQSSQEDATEAYRLANRGKDPTDERALVAFFATPQQGADFLEYLEAKQAADER